MRLLIINQYFPPDRAATAVLLGQLVQGLQQNVDITVICGRPTYNPEGAPLDMVPTWRVPLFNRGRQSWIFRLLNYCIFSCGACLLVLILRRRDVVMCWTDPPWIGLAGVVASKIKKSRLLWVCQDVYPEIVTAIKGSAPRWLINSLQQVIKIIHTRAHVVVVIGADMYQQLLNKGACPQTLQIIHNWAHIDVPDSPASLRHQLNLPGEAFIIMHAGNMGLSQDLDAFLSWAKITATDDSLRYVLVGDGVKYQQLRQQALYHKLSYVHFYPYQAQEKLPALLASADLHYVSLHQALTGFIVPSKTYNILAVGKPILARVAEHSELGRLLEKTGCGWLANDTAQATVDHIRHLQKHPELLDQAGQAGQRWLQAHATRAHAVSKYQSLIKQLASS